MLPTLKIRFERWRFNKDYGVYVSTHGRFRNRDKADLPFVTDHGYLRVKVDCTSTRYELAHRLVMLTWRPTTEASRLTVDHLDHNKRNNCLENLEWVTEEENQRRALRDDLPFRKKEEEKKQFLNKQILIDQIPITTECFIKQMILERPDLKEETIFSVVKGAAGVTHYNGQKCSILFGHQYAEME